ncbi:hypothetical protein Aoki45_32940 [Algoriphagus sp. oki45]|nr:hypothetical protein Aoki45_32940 [Algoriphagus sp. oki45]
MTGGIGFSRQGRQSFEDNHKLGKIRSKSSRPRVFLERKDGEESALTESISYLQSLREKRRKVQLWVGSIVTLIAILLLLFLTFLN